MSTIVVGCVAGLVTLAGTVPVVAEPEPAEVTVYANGVTVDAEGRIDYNIDPADLPGAIVGSQQGSRTAEGDCEFEAEQEGVAGSPTLLFITELSFDPNTCVRELARAEYPRDAVPPSVGNELGENPDTLADAATSYPDQPGNGLFATWSGSIKVNVEDPPQIDVTTTKSYLTWNSRRGSSHRSQWGWYTLTGWERESHSGHHFNGTTLASTDTKAHYRNGRFCLTIDTHTYHDRTYFRGYFNGAWYWSYKVRKKGGCNGLLHFEHIVDTP